MSSPRWILLAGTCMALAACGGGSPPLLVPADLPGPDASADTEPDDLPLQDGWICRPRETKCMGSTFFQCLDDGSDWTPQVCSSGQVCTPAGCSQPGTDIGNGEDATVLDAPDATVADDPSTPPDADAGPPDPGHDTVAADLPGHDNPPPECKAGDTFTVPCGLNGNGQSTRKCVDGHWTDPGECADPDACNNGTIQRVPCLDGSGQIVRECQKGQWVQASSTCAQPGHWTCEDNVCTPSYDAGACGDGDCYLSQGESDQSCPADCDYSKVDGEGQPCDQAFQCMFYPWPAGGVGYWECSGLPWDTQCHAIHDGTFCGTPDQDYCYRDAQYAETPASCPSDCPGAGDCGTAADCVLQPWPTP
jgi:hypothetical protein